LQVVNVYGTPWVVLSSMAAITPAVYSVLADILEAPALTDGLVALAVWRGRYPS
jgi:hypothetical protein